MNRRPGLHDQEGSEFVLECDVAVMLLLVCDVGLDHMEVRLADGKVGVTTLPFEFGIFPRLVFKPNIGDAFEFFDPVGLCDGASESAQEMHMVFNTANPERRTFEFFGNAT